MQQMSQNNSVRKIHPHLYVKIIRRNTEILGPPQYLWPHP